MCITAEGFRSAAQASAVRAYKTGDLVVQPAGSQDLFYVGRADDQVKVCACCGSASGLISVVQVRGNRVNLAELETLLLRHCCSCAVLLCDGSLVAFVEDSQIEIDEIQQCFARELPSYMHPARYITLERLPRVASGKVCNQHLSVSRHRC